MRAARPTQCDIGETRNSKELQATWIGYKPHLDTVDSMVPIAATFTAASTHDSQGAIPLVRISIRRVVWLYDIMDSAYCAQPLIEDCLASSRVPMIHPNTRSDIGLKAEIAADRGRKRSIPGT
jgi:hypothetical protein